MFTTAVKTSIVEALNAGFTSLASAPIDNSLDLTPNSVTIEYPLEMVQWPAILVQFRPSKIQWSGLQPDVLTLNSGTTTISGVTYSGAYTSNRTGYFEGSIDLQIMAMHSEERDRLYDSLTNLVLMGQGSPASNAFYNSILANDLVGMTILPDTFTPLGDSISAGTPFSPEELTYEASIRINCIGDFYETKYNYPVVPISGITTTGTLVPVIYTQSNY